MAKKIEHSVAGRDSLKRGVDAVADAVKVTLGPRGRNVAIERMRGKSSYDITKDGVTVAKSIQLKNPAENMGAQMIIDVAQQTVNIAGDGTTTATILAQAIITEGLKSLAAGGNPIEIKRGIDKAVEAVVKFLVSNTKQVSADHEMIKHVAFVSTNGDENMAQLITEAISIVKEKGEVLVEESKTSKSHIKQIAGFQIENGLMQEMFMHTPARMEIIAPYIVVTDKDIVHIEQIKPLLDMISKEQDERKKLIPLLIIAPNLIGEALATVILNNCNSFMHISAVRPCKYAEQMLDYLEDVADFTNSIFICEKMGNTLEGIQSLDQLGICQKVIIENGITTIIGGDGDPDVMEKKIKNLEDKIAEFGTTSSEDYNYLFLKERLSRITGTVARLYVGGNSIAEVKEKRDRIDDAVHATQAAISEGIIPGAGVAFLRAISELDKLTDLSADEKMGVQIVKKALEYPASQILDNAGKSSSLISGQILANTSFNYGYDAKKEVFGDMLIMGVIDPTKVARVALESAASIAGLMLTTECVITNDVEKGEVNNAR